MAIQQRRIDQFPDLLALHRANPDRYPFFLESVSQGMTTVSGNDNLSRWDILFAFPGQRLELNGEGGLQGDAPVDTSRSSDFLQQLDSWWQQESSRAASLPTLPFYGGWFLYLGYELGGQIEPILQRATGPKLADPVNTQRPQAMAVRCPAAILRDHQQQQTILVAEASSGEGGDYLEMMAADLQGLDAQCHQDSAVVIIDLREAEQNFFLNAVAQIKNYIKDGDVFQVNLSRRWQGKLPAETQAVDIYQSLRRHNPAPFAGLCVQKDWAIISSSPERLVSVDTARNIQTRPIAGTHPRGKDHADDEKISQALLQHPKERAEHIMLIDMERNDLGRVCQPGSIEVNELMVLESYAHVHHIVSNVRGRLRDEVTPGEVIRAVFPGGTITGCPKVRCMEIIAELEQENRGAYTGSMGYLNTDGSMDLNILIRSLVVDGQTISLRAGAGIVADSIPTRELEETRAKARGLLLALGVEVATER